MPDETHLKLAHNILATAEAAPLGIERADKVTRAQAYATLAAAEALGRIADVLESDAAPVSRCETCGVPTPDRYCSQACRLADKLV